MPISACVNTRSRERDQRSPLPGPDQPRGPCSISSSRSVSRSRPRTIWDIRWLRANSLAMPMQEQPVAGRERAGLLADPDLGVVDAVAAVVAHLVDVVAAGRVRLGGQDPTVGVLGHADHVRHHHPVVAVDERPVEPVRQGGGVPTALQRVVAEHHQPGNVVRPARSPAPRSTHCSGRPPRSRLGSRPANQLGSGWRAAELVAASGSPRRDTSRGARCSPASRRSGGRTPPPRRSRRAPRRTRPRPPAPPREDPAARGSAARTAVSGTSSGRHSSSRPRNGRRSAAGAR